MSQVSSTNSKCPTCGYPAGQLGFLRPATKDNRIATPCPDCNPKVTPASFVADVCPTCGFPPDEPGFLRSVSDDNLSKIIACPDCNVEKLARLNKNNSLPGQMKDHTFESYVLTDDKHQSEAYNSAVAFAANPVGFLTLYGTNGAGKSHLLAAIANQLGLGHARYFTLPDLVANLRHEIGDGDPERTLQRYANIDVLVIDEVDKALLLDKSSRPNWSGEQVFRLIEARYRYIDERGTVLASNLTPIELNEHFSYLVSRASDDRCKMVYIGNKDNRGIVTQLMQMAGLTGLLK